MNELHVSHPDRVRCDLHPEGVDLHAESIKRQKVGQCTVVPYAWHEGGTKVTTLIQLARVLHQRFFAMRRGRRNLECVRPVSMEEDHVHDKHQDENRSEGANDGGTGW